MLWYVKDIAMLSDICSVLAIMHNDGQKLHKHTSKCSRQKYKNNTKWEKVEQVIKKQGQVIRDSITE